MKRDPYKNQERWENFKEKSFKKTPKGIRKEDWHFLIKFLKDMELGLNTPRGKRGKRECGTLLNLQSHNYFFLKNFKKSLIKLKKEDLHKLESDVVNGKILKKDKKKFIAFGNYIKDFKVFWNWGLRTKNFKENIIEDISSKTAKPNWVYLTENQIQSLFNKLAFDYRVYSFFLYDSGMRVTEANSIQIKDFNKDFSQVTISDESAKTFGRTINLKLCSALLKSFIKEYKLKSEDYLFQKKVFTINKYLKQHCGKLFGKDKISHPKSKGLYGSFTMYDIRHNSVCFWFNKYPSHKGLMYRFGWRKVDKIEYYGGFLGVSDEITDEDMVLGQDRNKIYKLEKDNEQMKKEITSMKTKFKKVVFLVKDSIQQIKDIKKLKAKKK